MVTVYNKCRVSIGNILLFNDRELGVVDNIIKGEVTPKDLQCLCFILNEYIRASKPVQVTHIRIHYSTGVSERQVSRSTKHLATLGILKRERLGNQKYKYWFDKDLLVGSGDVANGGIPNIYIINILEKIIAPATDVHSQFIAYFSDKYQEMTGVKYPFRGAKDGSLVSAITEDYSFEQLKEFVDRFFVMKDEFIAKAGRHIGIFKSQIPAIIEQINRDKQQNDYQGVPR